MYRYWAPLLSFAGIGMLGGGSLVCVSVNLAGSFLGCTFVLFQVPMNEPELCALCDSSIQGKKPRVKSYLPDLVDAENINPANVWIHHQCYLEHVLVPKRKLAQKKVLCVALGTFAQRLVEKYRDDFVYICQLQHKIINLLHACSAGLKHWSMVVHN
jgi:hypothetical protein